MDNNQIDSRLEKPAHERVSQSPESPENLKNRLVEDSQKDVESFSKTVEGDVAQLEMRDGMVLGEDDKAELLALGKAGVEAREELLSEVGGENQTENKEQKILSPEIFQQAKELIHELYKTGLNGTTKYVELMSLIAEDVNGKMQWKDIKNIDAGGVNNLLGIAQPENKQIVPPGMNKEGDKKESREEEKISPEVFGQVKAYIHQLYTSGQGKTSLYNELVRLTTSQFDGKTQWKEVDDIKASEINELMKNNHQEKSEEAQIAETVTEEAVEEEAPGWSRDNVTTKERVIKEVEVLSNKEASKKHHAEERNMLAREIMAERKLNREKLSELRIKAKELSAKLESQSVDWDKMRNEHEELSNQRSDEATSLAGRIRGLLSSITGHKFSSDIQAEQTLEEKQQQAQEMANNVATLHEELESIQLLIDGDTTRQQIKDKINSHYNKVESASKERIDEVGRSLENVMHRNNAFIVHKIEEREGLRHNDNSNVSGETTYADDIDIMLSLEPSVSASSVTPGIKATVWPGASGFIFGRGQISEAGSCDIGTVAHGIKRRGREKSSIDRIDDVVGRKSDMYKQIYQQHGEHGMNEVVVNNPEVFGFFQHAEVDEDGIFWAGSLHVRDQAMSVKEKGERSASYKVLNINVNEYRKRFDVAHERGLPLYIMTGDRRVYECLAVNDDGSILTGKELTPEDVAKGNAGLPSENRRDLGKKLLQKDLFKSTRTQQEAEKIVDSL